MKNKRNFLKSTLLAMFTLLTDATKTYSPYLVKKIQIRTREDVINRENTIEMYIEQLNKSTHSMRKYIEILRLIKYDLSYLFDTKELNSVFDFNFEKQIYHILNEIYYLKFLLYDEDANLLQRDEECNLYEIQRFINTLIKQDIITNNYILRYKNVIDTKKREKSDVSDSLKNNLLALGIIKATLPAKYNRMLNIKYNIYSKYADKQIAEEQKIVLDNITILNKKCVEIFNIVKELPLGVTLQSILELAASFINYYIEEEKEKIDEAIERFQKESDRVELKEKQQKKIEEIKCFYKKIKFFEDIVTNTLDSIVNDKNADFLIKEVNAWLPQASIIASKLEEEITILSSSEIYNDDLKLKDDVESLIKQYNEICEEIENFYQGDEKIKQEHIARLNLLESNYDLLDEITHKLAVQYHTTKCAFSDLTKNQIENLIIKIDGLRLECAELYKILKTLKDAAAELPIGYNPKLTATRDFIDYYTKEEKIINEAIAELKKKNGVAGLNQL